MSIEDNKKAMPFDGTRLIQDVLAELGWSADAAVVADSVRRLDVGLPVEDEFSVVCAWLGRCQLLHKLDRAEGNKFFICSVIHQFHLCHQY